MIQPKYLKCYVTKPNIYLIRACDVHEPLFYNISHAYPDGYDFIHAEVYGKYVVIIADMFYTYTYYADIERLLKKVYHTLSFKEQLSLITYEDFVKVHTAG